MLFPLTWAVINFYEKFLMHFRHIAMSFLKNNEPQFPREFSFFCVAYRLDTFQLNPNWCEINVKVSHIWNLMDSFISLYFALYRYCIVYNVVVKKWRAHLYWNEQEQPIFEITIASEPILLFIYFRLRWNKTVLCLAF